MRDRNKGKFSQEEVNQVMFAQITKRLSRLHVKKTLINIAHLHAYYLYHLKNESINK